MLIFRSAHRTMLQLTQHGMIFADSEILGWHVRDGYSAKTSKGEKNQAFCDKR
jgi:hypothetical protein